MSKIIQYIGSVKSEMSKVTWPTRDEVKGATTLVVVFALFFAVVVKVFDMFIGRLVAYLMGL